MAMENQKARRVFLRQNPLCKACLPRVEAARVVDHVIPHRGDMVLFWDRSNWQPLCLSCHNAKSARERGEGGSNV